MASARAAVHDRGMSLGLAIARTLPRRHLPSHPPVRLADVAMWATFAIAAVVFVLDATTTVAVVAIRPDAAEQNPIAAWTLGVHPAAPYLLKAAVVAECAVACALARSMGERWAGWLIVAMMATVGLLGIATAVTALSA